RVQVNHVDADVDDADQQNPQQQGARQDALRIFDFAGNPGHVNPSVISPKNGDQCDSEAGDHVRQRSRLIERQIDRVVRPGAFADSKAEQNEDADGGELGPGSDVDQRRAALQAEDVDGSEKNYGSDGDKVAARQRAAENRCDGLVGRGKGKYGAEVLPKSYGER